MIKTLKAKLLFSFAIIIVVNALVGVFTIVQLTNVREEAREMVEIEVPLLAAFGSAVDAISEELLAMREYRYSGNPTYREAFNRAHLAWLASLEEIRPLFFQSELSQFGNELDQAVQFEQQFNGLFQQLADYNAVLAESDERFERVGDIIDDAIADTLMMISEEAARAPSLITAQATLERFNA